MCRVIYKLLGVTMQKLFLHLIVISDRVDCMGWDRVVCGGEGENFLLQK